MIGKLQNWRGDHTRSKDWRHSGVGGLVSIEDLARKPKSPPAGGKTKKVSDGQISQGASCGPRGYDAIRTVRHAASH